MFWTAAQNESYDRILDRLMPHFAGHSFSPGIIVDHMAEAADILIENRFVLQPPEVDLTEIAKVCAAGYLRHNKFTLLHTVTGCHAARVIAPYLFDIDGALRCFWQAVVIAYLSTGIEYRSQGSSPPPPKMSWEKIQERAVAGDE